MQSRLFPINVFHNLQESLWCWFFLLVLPSKVISSLTKKLSKATSFELHFPSVAYPPDRFKRYFHVIQMQINLWKLRVQLGINILALDCSRVFTIELSITPGKAVSYLGVVLKSTWLFSGLKPLASTSYVKITWIFFKSPNHYINISFLYRI